MDQQLGEGGLAGRTSLVDASPLVMGGIHSRLFFGTERFRLN